jgi:alpha-acetolactate decarboxylase
MNLTQCELQLQTVYDKNPILGENISKITNTAWWADKSYCLQRMGGVSNVKSFLFQKASYVAPKEEDVVVNQPSQEVQATTGTSTSFLDSLWLDAVASWGYYIFWGIGITLLTIILTKFIRKLLRFCYDVLNAP